ncbi:dephospho-CoA kinase [Actinopolyspora mortivallis]|uniref:dephospho-CoA kinase n=1 Tax=Actinopolyspora mortivallis TaxID=33906 RepID=UPI00036C82F9|nr:dephospho-CoA kinase [Actinopolyspora mortivallis]
MLRVGLTGGIGSGKSTVAERLARHGAVVVDADRISREVVAPGTEGLAEIAARFGSEVLDEEGALDRAAMARLVFADETARRDLNGIVHPRVAARTSELVAAAGEEAIVVHDVPLLVENGYQADYHLVIVVDAPVEQRVRRLLERGLAEEDARARIEAQASRQQRAEAADVWLDNSSDPAGLYAEVDRLWEQRLVPFETNVRTRTPCSLGGIEPTEPDRDWPRQARRVAARIAEAVGGEGTRVDHIGSTSVPGLIARDVLDLQLTVRSRDEAEELAEPLAAAGFPRSCDSDSEDPWSGAGRGWWRRRHLSADPGRGVELHLRLEDTANWRLALLLPAWLRSDERARAEYAELKRRYVDPSGAGAAVAEYSAAKRAWFEGALPRAERWAERTGWSPHREVTLR